MAEPKLKEIADRIWAHLKRFEKDPAINRRRSYSRETGWVDDPKGSPPYFHASTFARGAYVGVTYISYQHTSNLKKAEAVRYLKWLDDGNVGTHHQAFRQMGLDNIAKRIEIEEAEKEGQ